MSLVQMLEIVKQQKLTEGQVTWWPRWLDKYARWTRQVNADRIEIREQPLIQLLQTLRDSGKNAFARLQVVRAIEFYQKHVLETEAPDLSFIRLKLEELVAKEKTQRDPASQAGTVPVGTNEAEILPDDDKMLIGRIDASDAPLLQEMRKLMRVRHYATRTERSYVGWAQRFAGSVGGWERVREVGEPEIKEVRLIVK